jgi:UDP-N-acetyl-D-glucosamine dehydrogenase
VPTFQVGDIEFKVVECTPERLRQADCVVILADHPDFDYETVAREAPLIVDTRQAIPTSAAGARVVRI